MFAAVQQILARCPAEHTKSLSCAFKIMLLAMQLVALPTPRCPKAHFTRAARSGCPSMMAPRPQLSGSLLAADCTVLVCYGLLANSLKAFGLASSDLLSPDFDLAADVASFDIAATMRYVGVEQFAAASLAVGWLVGGVVSGACDEEWRALEEQRQRRRLLTGWLAAAPLACLCKYGLLSQQDLPSLGRSAQAKLLEAQLSGLSAPNVLADAAGMLVVLVLWRRLLLRSDWIL